MNVAIIGCGDVGQCYATAIHEAKHRIIGISDSRPTPAMEQFAASLACPLHTTAGPWLQSADIVISAVFGGTALDVARAVIPHLNEKTLYADFTTASAEHMRSAAHIAKEHDVRFLDIALMGTIDLTGAHTPLLYAGHHPAPFVELVESIQAPAQSVGDRPGDAVTLKLLRSVFTKGVEALTVECLLAAEQCDLRESLYSVLADLDHVPIRKFMEVVVNTHVRHAVRRAKEVQEAQAMLNQLGVKPLTLKGAASRFAHTSGAIAERPYQGEHNIQASLAWLAVNEQQTT